MTASIAGVVTAAGSGAPLAGAEVRVSGPAAERRLITTNDDGRFELRDLSAGAYRITAARAGFAAGTARSRGGRTGDATTIALSEGQHLDVGAALARGAVISGRVIDAFGEPVVGVRVQALRAPGRNSAPDLGGASVVDSTDDAGTFRLHGLPAGTYYVRTGGRPAAAGYRAQAVYYPGTPVLDDALAIVVAAGDEAAAEIVVGTEEGGRGGDAVRATGLAIE